MLSTVVLSTIMPWLVSVASAVVAGAVPVGMLWLSKHLAMARIAMQNALIHNAVGRGAALALSRLTSHGSFNPKTAALGNPSAISVGVTYVVRSFPDIVAALGLTPEHISEMVTAELMKLLNLSSETVTAPVTPTASLSQTWRP